MSNPIPKMLADLPAPDAKATRAILARLRMDEYVARVVAEAPPLSDEQRSRIGLLLSRGADDLAAKSRPRIDLGSDPIADLRDARGQG